MTQLSALIDAVKEQNLSKEQLEEYRNDLANLGARMSLEMADLEKKEALYLDADTEEAVTRSKRKWNATEEGQRQIQLKHSIRATDKILSSLKSRLYNFF